MLLTGLKTHTICLYINNRILLTLDQLMYHFSFFISNMNLEERQAAWFHGTTGRHIEKGSLSVGIVRICREFNSLKMSTNHIVTFSFQSKSFLFIFLPMTKFWREIFVVEMIFEQNTLHGWQNEGGWR